jgi:hypothetical protein
VASSPLAPLVVLPDEPLPAASQLVRRPVGVPSCAAPPLVLPDTSIGTLRLSLALWKWNTFAVRHRAQSALTQAMCGGAGSVAWYSLQRPVHQTEQRPEQSTTRRRSRRSGRWDGRRTAHTRPQAVPQSAESEVNPSARHETRWCSEQSQRPGNSRRVNVWERPPSHNVLRCGHEGCTSLRPAVTTIAPSCCPIVHASR